MRPENLLATYIAADLRAVFDGYPAANLRPMVKATVIVLTGLLDAWPAETRQAEYQRAIETLTFAAETSESLETRQ